MDQGIGVLARDYAIRAHRDQRYGDGKPYVEHFDDVKGTLVEDTFL